MKETVDSLRKIRTAMLLLVLDINIMGFDILPDFAAWLLMLSAIALLEGKAQGIGRLRNFGRALAVFDGIFCLCGIGVTWEIWGSPFAVKPEIVSYVNVLLVCIRIYFMYTLLTASADIAMADGGEAESARKLCLGRSLALLAELGVYISASVSITWDGVAQFAKMIVILLSVLYFIFYFYCILGLTYLKEEIEKGQGLGELAEND